MKWRMANVNASEAGALIELKPVLDYDLPVIPTRQMARDASEASGHVFKNVVIRDSIARDQAREIIAAWEGHAAATCIPIIPPGQDDESEPPKDVGIPRDTFFEKRIKRVGGPARVKPKPLFTPEPVAATPNPSDEWVHRAIGIAGQRR